MSKSLFYLCIYLPKMANLKQPSNLYALVILSRSKVPVAFLSTHIQVTPYIALMN